VSTQQVSITHTVVVETEVLFSLEELSRICNVDIETMKALVHEGVLVPQDERATHWQFQGTALARARAATRLLRDMEMNAAGTALVMDLMDEIRALKSQLRRLGA
jgi:chaperone modulatory protein CbpM